MDMDKNNQTIFQPSMVRVITSLLFVLATGIFFVLGYFGVIDQSASGLVRTAGLFFGLCLFILFIRGALFTPILLKFDGQTLIFKRLLSFSSVKIPEQIITKICIRWRKYVPLIRLWKNPRRLYSMTIYVSGKEKNKAYYLYLLTWEPLPNHKIIEQLKETPLRDKIVETTKRRFYLFG